MEGVRITNQYEQSTKSKTNVQVSVINDISANEGFGDEGKLDDISRVDEEMVVKLTNYFNLINKNWYLLNDSERSDVLQNLHQYNKNPEFKRFHTKVKVKLIDKAKDAYRVYKLDMEI